MPDRPDSVRTSVPRLALVAALGALLVARTTGATPARAQQTSDPTTVWSRLLGALNQGDAGSAAALFAADAVYEQADSACATPCSGREAIMQQLQNVVSTRPTLTTLPDVSVAGNVVSGRLQVQSDATTAVNSFSMAVLDDQIVALRVSAPMGSSLASAGAGGLMRAHDARDAALLALLALALGYAGVRLLRESAANG